jgi:hypothetical protein
MALAASLAVADDQTPPARGAAAGPNIDVIVPVPPYEHERLHYFGQRDHHLVPGAVTVNKPPYVCDVDQRRFQDRDAFLVHLRVVHHARSEEIPDQLVVLDGQVHYLGDK